MARALADSAQCGENWVAAITFCLLETHQASGRAILAFLLIHLLIGLGLEFGTCTLTLLCSKWACSIFWVSDGDKRTSLLASVQGGGGMRQVAAITVLAGLGHGACALSCMCLKSARLHFRNLNDSEIVSLPTSSLRKGGMRQLACNANTKNTHLLVQLGLELGLGTRTLTLMRSKLKRAIFGKSGDGVSLLASTRRAGGLRRTACFLAGKANNIIYLAVPTSDEIFLAGRPRRRLGASPTQCRQTRRRPTAAAALLALAAVPLVPILAADADHFFCGTSWADASENCDERQHCQGGTDDECETAGNICFGGTTCDSKNGHGNKFKYANVPYEDISNTRFCAAGWSEAVDSCR